MLTQNLGEKVKNRGIRIFNLINNNSIKQDFFGFNLGLPNGYDANNLVKSGFYSGWNMQNTPANNQWMSIIAICQNGNPNYTHQLGFILGNASLWHRVCNGGTWSKWFYFLAN